MMDIRQCVLALMITAVIVSSWPGVALLAGDSLQRHQATQAVANPYASGKLLERALAPQNVLYTASSALALAAQR